MSQQFRNNSEIAPKDSTPAPGERDAAARFAAYTARLAALVQSRLAPRYRSRLDAEDVVASAWRSFLVGVREDRWDLSATDLWPLLAMLVTRKLHKQLRRNRDVDSQEGSDPAAITRDAPTTEEATAAVEALESALDDLDPLDREVVLLRLRGDSTAEIAAATGASERSISRAFASASESLRQQAGIDQHEFDHIDLSAVIRRPATNNVEQAWTVGGDLPKLQYSNLKLVRLIGQGGVGRVYRAVDRTTGHNLAVKFLKKQFWKHAIALQSLSSELETLSRISHPGVVRSRGWGRTPSGTPFIASELIEGQTLEEWSRSTHASISEKLSRLADVAEALSAVHAAGIVHGDVTPTNILCEQTGRTVLVDFGLATAIQTPSVSRTGATLAFAAPEQLSPAFGPIGPWTDLYGLASTTFTILTGNALPDGNTRAEIIASILSGPQSKLESTLKPLLPPDLVKLLSQCVAQNSHARPEAATVMNLMRSHQPL
jgi:RNA polymerase sigma factor (sigma-70 family)